MAKKKSTAPKTSAKKARSPQPNVRTVFMRAFTSEFIYDSTSKVWKWPTGSPPPSNDSIVADFETFINVLLRAEVLKQPVPADGSGSLSDRLAKFLIAQNWPFATKIPTRWQGIQPSIRLIEISVIADRLLHAINQFRGAGAGAASGNPSGWPPH